MNPERLQLYFFGTLLISVIALSVFLFLPYLGPLAFSAVLAVLSYPLYTRLRSILRYDGVASIVTVLLVSLIVLGPLVFIGSLLFQEARDAAVALRFNEGAGPVLEIVAPIEQRIEQFLPATADINFESVVREGLDWLTRNLSGAFASTAQIFVGLMVGLIAFYYFLKDGARFTATLVTLSPLEDAFDHEILEKLRMTISSVIRGSLAVAVIQGCLTGLGFAVFGLPSPILWGAVAAISALIPGIGTALVIAPGILFLLLTGQLLAAVGLLVWGVTAVGLIDNFLGPKLMGYGVHLHPLFILLSVLGGLTLFGPSGLLLGPLILSLLYALGHIYTILIRGRSDVEMI